jgi:cytochrome P450
VKDLKLGNFTFKKGDSLNVPVGLLMWDPEYFPKEREFDIDALNEKNQKQFHAFLLG